MTYASLDYYSFDRPAPDVLTDDIFDYLCSRQTDSLDLPGGVFRYLNWQSGGADSTTMFGRRISDGISYATLVHEWPKVRRLLDGGHLAPLALIRADSADPRKLTENHQVLAYGYELNEPAEILTLRVLDPNFPRDGNVTLRMGTGNPDFYRPIIHSGGSGNHARAFFLSNYVVPQSPP